MSIETEKSLNSLIDELTSYVEKLVVDAKNSGQIKAGKERYRKWVFNDFKYDDAGIVNHSASSKEFTRDNWDRVSAPIHYVIEQSSLYSKILSKLKLKVKNKDTETILDSFISESVTIFLENNDTSKTDKLKSIFLNEVNDIPIRQGVSVEIVGLTLRSNNIKLSNTTTIRKITREDLEIEIDENFFSTRYHGFPYPTVILEIDDYLSDNINLQRKEWLSIAILRLFKVSSVRALRTIMFSDSFAGYFGGIMYSMDRTRAQHIKVIKESEDNQLQHFWQSIENHIPKSFYDPMISDSNYSDIAYHRYCDALLKVGTEEFRITNAMMGLESIFLRDDGELQELSYRLALRTAKLISNFDYEPFEVSKIIKDAYTVRSNFVHGGLLSYKKKTKLAEKYGSMNELIEKLLDFLRLAIITSITIMVSKDELIDTIDKSFLDSKSQEKLNQLISSTKRVLEV